jgi:hypothetical protein
LARFADWFAASVWHGSLRGALFCLVSFSFLRFSTDLNLDSISLPVLESKLPIMLTTDGKNGQKQHFFLPTLYKNIDKANVSILYSYSITFVSAYIKQD